MNRPSFRPLLPSLALAVAAALFPGSLHATGGYDEDPAPTLPDFLKLDQLPAKTFQQIFEETAQPVPKAEEVNVKEAVAAFQGLTGQQVLARIDQLLPRARATSDFETLNLLNDLRDLYAGPANAAETAEYVAWRTDGKAYDSSEIAERLKKSSPALRPHYLYLQGAIIFRDHRDVDSQVWFEKVVKEFPKHPRAEIALYMNARAQLSRSRTSNYMANSPELDPAQRPRAKQLLEQYLAKYPKGRWAGDALGWLGAWHYDGKEFGEALRCYLGQLDNHEHPELFRSARVMCEKTLSHLASSPKDKAWAEVAKHPQAAQALVYILLNSRESDNYNGEFDPVDTVRAWRKKLLPQVAAAIAAQDKLYHDASWRPRYLATLALAASGIGQQDQALKLLGTVGAEAESDDVLLARGVVLQRARRPQEAIPAFRALLEKFPKSPLARGARLRIALALVDNHQAGEAVLAIDKMLVKPVAAASPAPDPSAQPTPAPAATPAPAVTPGPDPEPDEAEEGDPSSYKIYSDVEDEQLRQLADLWLNFAPVEELVAPTLQPGFDPVQKLRLTEPVAERLLAKEQFDEAKKYLTPAQYGLVAGPLEKLTLAARAATDPEARIKACLALGDAWAAARGKLLTYPLDTEKNRLAVYPNATAYANNERSEAATLFGYSGNFRLDLENRDELRHAFNWWLEASDVQVGTANTATALWKALRAMPLIADVSPYTQERARARKWDEVSRKLYDRLRSECADSVEARRFAVYWNLPKKADDPLVPGEPPRAAAGTEIDPLDSFGMERSYSDDAKERQSLEEDLKKLIAAAGQEKPEVMKARMEHQLQAARAKFTGLYDARWINFYEDLAQFFSQAEVSPEIRSQYVMLRGRFLTGTAIGGGWEWNDMPGTDEALQKQIATALANPATKPVADFYEFLNLAIIANHFTFVKFDNKPKDKESEALEKGEEDTYRTRDYPLLVKKTEAFLAKYPQSTKKEAALLLRARGIYRASAEVTTRNFATWPQGARWEGGYLGTVSSQEPFEAKRVQAALDDYDKAFPKGRYAGDIRDYRAGVAFRLRDWKSTLDLTIAELADRDRLDLHEAALQRLVDLFTLLSDERYRAELLPVIKGSPRGVEMLKKFLTSQESSFPLQYMTSWLREQLAKP